MNKTFKFLIAIILMLNVMFSAVAQKNKTSTDIKLITTKQFFEPYDLVYKAMMSLMHSKEFMIDETDYDTGLILISKGVYKNRKAYLNKGIILIDKLNDELTEVKLSMYIGESKTSLEGVHRRTENMNKDPEFYNKWFNNLYIEIQRRKALR